MKHWFKSWNLLTHPKQEANKLWLLFQCQLSQHRIHSVLPWILSALLHQLVSVLIQIISVLHRKTSVLYGGILVLPRNVSALIILFLEHPPVKLMSLILLLWVFNIVPRVKGKMTQHYLSVFLTLEKENINDHSLLLLLWVLHMMKVCTHILLFRNRRNTGTPNVSLHVQYISSVILSEGSDNSTSCDWCY